MTRLSDVQLQAIERAVRAVVLHDHETLAEIAPAECDLYLWTRDYGDHGDVELVIPPGSPSEWDIDAVGAAGDPARMDVEVGMWTRQEGRSDLTLTVDLEETAPGRWQPAIRDLHVL
jgi:hypothetical protein